MSWLQLPYNAGGGRACGRSCTTPSSPTWACSAGIIPPIGAFDLSPIVALIVLGLVNQIVVS